MQRLKEKRIFLIDALGAVFSVLCLLILYSFEELFGMPKSVLRIFIAVAILFSAYSLTCYFVNPKFWRPYLAIIAILNISYCLFTMYQLAEHVNTITFLGYVYFSAELLIVLILSFYELKLSRKITTL
jgi:hypothetical protein